MARRKTYNQQAVAPMNQWVRDAFAYALEQGRNITYNEMADELTAASLGQPYDKTKVQKMTIARKVTLAEAEVISRVTGFPTRESQNGVAGLSIRYEALSEKRKNLLLDLLDDLEAAEAVDRLAEEPTGSSHH